MSVAAGGDRQALAAWLDWMAAMGADEAIGEAPANRFAQSAARRRAAETAAPAKAPAAPTAMPKAGPASPDAGADAEAIAEAAADLAALKQALQAYDGCPDLKSAARSTVFADGVAGADVMLVGEAPGAEEDRQGKPFVGASGQLLDRVAAAIGLSRQETLYISNILPWRPPANRPPSTEEMARCLPFIRRHIALAAPKIVVLLGGTAARALLDTNTGIMRLRGRWQTLPGLGRDAPMACLPTLHPAYLLRNPAAKAQAWSDWLALADRLGAPGRTSAEPGTETEPEPETLP